MLPHYYIKKLQYIWLLNLSFVSHIHKTCFSRIISWAFNTKYAGITKSIYTLYSHLFSLQFRCGNWTSWRYLRVSSRSSRSSRSYSMCGEFQPNTKVFCEVRTMNRDVLSQIVNSSTVTIPCTGKQFYMCMCVDIFQWKIWSEYHKEAVFLTLSITSLEVLALIAFLLQEHFSSKNSFSSISTSWPESWSTCAGEVQQQEDVEICHIMEGEKISNVFTLLQDVCS